MKKNYLVLLLCFFSIIGYAQENGVIKYSTTHPLGTEISFFPTTVNTGEKVKVDWGDGEIKEYTITMWNKKVSGNKTGDTIRVLTQLKSFDCSDSQVNSITVVDQPGLESLQCYNNDIARDSLDISGALNLERLDCHNNDRLLLLNLMQHTKLTSLDCYSYEQGSITTILLPESDSELTDLSAYNNDISALNVAGCPKLENLNMENNALMEIDVTKLPELTNLNVAQNHISTLNVSKNPKLFKLFCSKNQLEALDLFANNELLEISCSDNKLTALDLSANTGITKIYCSNNAIRSLDVTGITRLTQMKCEFNQLEKLDLSKNFYLQKLWCQSNKLTYLDLYYNANINYIDCRDNTGMTPCSLNFMYSSLSGQISVNPNTNLFISGCNAETSDTNIAKEARWTPDVTGDGTASCDDVELTLAPAENGTYELSQPTLSGHNLVPVEGNKVKAGYPVYVHAEPAEGYRMKSIRVGERTIADTIFVASEATSFAVNFVPLISNIYVTMDVEAGTNLSIGISGSEPETEIEIDWGNGILESQVIGNTNILRIEGVSKGTTVRINGMIDYLDCSETDLAALDVSHNNYLKTLDCYWTNITALDVTKNTELTKLNCSFNPLGTLDVTNNTKLFSLSCYNCELPVLDVSRNVLLEELTAKNNELTAIDLSANPKLVALDIQNNEIGTLNISHLADLESLACSGNGMTQLDVTANTKLTHLTCSYNKLTTIDLSKNTLLQRLFCNDNQLESLTLNENGALSYIECSGNGMSACTLNDFYYNLPFCPVDPDKINIYNQGTTNPNDAGHSETVLATRKGWKVSAQGDGSGCDQAYLTFKQPENGTIALFNGTEEIVSGSKVDKNSVIEVKNTPAERYEIDWVKANGVKITDNKFTVVMATDVEAQFKLASGIEEIESGISILTGKNALRILAEQASVNVYTVTGTPVYEGIVEGSSDIRLDAGSYVVRVNTPEKQHTQVVIVY